MTDTEFLDDMWSFSVDHEPDGWPAIQQRDLSRLVGMVDDLLAQKARVYRLNLRRSRKNG